MKDSSDITQAWDRVIVLANRAPFRHEPAADGTVRLSRSASGLVTALEPLVEAYSGIWVAHGSGTADPAGIGARDSLDVPPANPRYRLRYVHLTDAEHHGYYYGFANEGLWPLCHSVDVPPVFRAGDFRMYRIANQRFAAAVNDEAVDRSPLVFVQDYHFALAPRMLRRRLPASTIIAFWHIPWPDPRVFRTCPWRRELLDGLLGSDIVGFQTPEDCVNFLETVEQTLGGCIDYEQNAVSFRGRTTRARVYPVGVEWNNPHVRALPASRVCRARVCRELGLPPDVRLGVGVDRLDYTKGINEKFLAVERLLECQPELRGRFVFVQVAEPSRACLPAYRTARNQLAATAGRVNARFGAESYRPILLLERHHEPADVYRLYRAADFCYVGSLHDGMNLVAKEFVSARADERGVLVLSRFAGSAHQLRGALTINPYLIEESATALSTALAMPDSEQADRMRRMRQIVETFDTYWWADQMLRDALPVRWAGEPLPSQSHAPVHGMSA